jgi:succinylarginine dihydrolase
VVRRHWPVEIDGRELRQPALIRDIQGARAALLDAMGLTELA